MCAKQAQVRRVRLGGEAWVGASAGFVTSQHCSFQAAKPAARVKCTTSLLPSCAQREREDVRVGLTLQGVK